MCCSGCALLHCILISESWRSPYCHLHGFECSRHCFFSISHRAGFVMGELLISDGDQTVGLHGISGGGNVPGFLRLGLSNKLN